jgi:hypothetical protein
MISSVLRVHLPRGGILGLGLSLLLLGFLLRTEYLEQYVHIYIVKQRCFFTMFLRNMLKLTFQCFSEKNQLQISDFDISYIYQMKHEIFSIGSVAIFLNDISMDVALKSKVVSLEGWGGGGVWQVL